MAIEMNEVGYTMTKRIKGIYWATVFIWAGLVFGADSLGMLPQVGGATAWSWVFTGAGMLSPARCSPNRFGWCRCWLNGTSCRPSLICSPPLECCRCWGTSSGCRHQTGPTHWRGTTSGRLHC